MLTLVLIVFGCYAALKYADHVHRAKGYQGPATDHFNGNIFYSYGSPATNAIAIGKRKPILKWILHRKRNKWLKRKNTLDTTPIERVMGGELVVTFINHATVLIQTEGKNVLTDPIWSKRASPFHSVGPARFRAPGVKLENLPPIDVVLISHNHYDHLDLDTLKLLQKKCNPKIVVGLGNAEYLKERGIMNIVEIDWWDRTPLADGVDIVCAPGQHFSSRTLSDRNNTLWCGYIIESKNGNIYFAGDTGYGKFVETISARYKEFRLALLPIGAFRPQWFMGPVHISPDQAVQIHNELNVQTSVGIHFGTFQLADDMQDEPQARISELVTLTQEKKTDFRVLDHGEVIHVN